MRYIAAIDPGKDKCGFAVLAIQGEILLQDVIQTAELIEKLRMAVQKYSLRCLVLGNGTTSRMAAQRIQGALPELEIEIVDEYRTTEIARNEYWKVHPPSGWRRLLPVTMQVPPVPVDDFVAVLLARRYIKYISSSEKKA